MADGFNTVSQNSVRQTNTCHLWISCTALMLFSAPIFWGFFEPFNHKKVSRYYIINIRKSFLSLFLFPFWEFFSFSFFILTTMRTGPMSPKQSDYSCRNTQKVVPITSFLLQPHSSLNLNSYASPSNSLFCCSQVTKKDY